jgi:glutathione S-transferase
MWPSGSGLNVPQTRPLLYTFRRCPYAIRARLAIATAGVTVNEHEVSLRDKPAEMLAISPKGTVPVLQLGDGRVIDESINIMRWALAQHDPQDWLGVGTDETQALIQLNDSEFKRALDRYKYPNRYPERSATDYRGEGERFLVELELRLSSQLYLTGNQIRWVDAAIVPFIRQFAAVDPAWFSAAPYPHLRRWLDGWLVSPLFLKVMAKPSQTTAA